MAAPQENSLSLGYGIGMERNIFIQQRERSQDSSTSVLQYLEEVKKRELAAKVHNKQLLHQFEEAQDTLRLMITLTASMKTVRMEYERYLEYERCPLWQQQVWERRQAAQRKRMEEQIQSTQKNTSDDVAKASADQLLTLQADYNQDPSSSLPHTPSRWMSCVHPQSRFSASLQPSQQHRHHVSMTGQDEQVWLRQSAPAQASLQSVYPWSCTAGISSVPEALRQQRNAEDSLAEREALQAETSEVSCSKTERCSSHLSQELDDRPVRLSDIPVGSSCESSQVSSSKKKKKKKKEKRGSSCSSSDRKGSVSQESSKTSSVTITAVPCKVSQKSDNSVSSEECISVSMRRRKKGGRATENQRTQRAPKVKYREEEEEEEEEGHSKSPKDESRKEESGSQKEEKPQSSSEKCRNVGGNLSSSSVEVSGGEEEAEEEQQRPLKEAEEEDGDSDVSEDIRDKVREKQDTENIPERQTSKDKEEMCAEEETEDQESDEEDDQVEESESLSDEEKGSQPPTSLQGEKRDEEQSKGGNDNVEERGESDQEGEVDQEMGEGEESSQAEESDSDDIISPQSRSGKLHNISENKEENEKDEDDHDKDGSTSEKSESEGSSDNDDDGDGDEEDDDDIEHLLAPPEETEEKQEEHEEKQNTKAFCKVQSFQVKTVESAKTDDPRDSDEYDDFYD